MPVSVSLPRTNAVTLETPRLRLICATVRLAHAAATSNADLAQEIGVHVPTDWPPEHLSDALPFIAESIEQSPDDAGWGMWFIVLRKEPASVVGSCGYKGKPNAEGRVDVGYSFVPSMQNQGIASEACSALIENAWRDPRVQVVVAETLPGLGASVRVMEKCGMRRAGRVTGHDGEPDVLQYRITRKQAARLKPPRRSWLDLIEAALPFAIAQAYTWIATRPRSRWADAACGVTILLAVVLAARRAGPWTLRGWGLGPLRDHARALLYLAPYTLIAIAVVVLGARIAGQSRPITDDFWGSFAAYPLWGFAQQAMLLGVALPRLERWVGRRWVPIVCALLFAAAHAPNPALMAGTGLMALVFAAVWQRAPSLPLSALSHGWVGAVYDKLTHWSMRMGGGWLTP